jgi:hypothetical protein
MDGFALAKRICSCTDEPILYSDIPSALIRPYFPEGTLYVAEFLRFKLPTIQTNLQTVSTRLSHHPPSITELTESDPATTAASTHVLVLLYMRRGSQIPRKMMLM